MPGMGTPIETAEYEPHAGPSWAEITKGIVIVSTAVDATNTPTTTLRNGLLMGRITSTGKYIQYDPTATDGSNVCRGYLKHPVDMLDGSNAAADKQGMLVIWAADVKAGSLIGIDNLARRQLSHRFIFDDDFWVNSDTYLPRVVAKTADYTVLAADNNTVFTNKGAAGAVNFTLPTLARGLRYTFFVEADQNVTITSVVADTMVVFNDAAADSIAFSTSSEKIGGCIEVFANSDASKWLTKVSLGAETQTPTIAT